MATFTPFNNDIATMHLCRSCLAKGVTRSVATVPGRPVVILTLVCQSCGHHWTVERIPNVTRADARHSRIVLTSLPLTSTRAAATDAPPVALGANLFAPRLSPVVPLTPTGER
jgi:hypothetical protein